MSGNRRAKKILAIDWDGRTLRLVHAFFGKRGPKIDRVLSIPIPKEVDTTSPEQMGLHIRRALEQEGIGTTHVIVDIPRDQAILNTLTLPVGSPEDLPGMVEIQIAKELPFAVADAVIDFAVPQVSTDATTADVLVAAVRREVLEQYEATLAAAGLKLDRIGLRPYAHKVAVCDRLKHAMPERVLFIDVRPTLTEIDILRDSSLAFSRAASVVIPETKTGGIGAPSSPPTDSIDGDTPPRLTLLSGGASSNAAGGDGGAVQDIILEITRSIEAYRASDPGAEIDLAVIGGDVGIEQELADAIQARLGIHAELYNPASSFGWEPDEGAAASAYAATLGLVLAQADDPSLHFDFLHPKKATSVAKERLRRAPLVAAVFLLFACAGWVFMSRMTGTARAELVQINASIKDLEKNTRANKKFLKFVNDIEAFDEQYVWVDILDDVISALPSHEEVVLSRVSMNQGDGLVVLKTRTKRRETPGEIIKTLESFRRQGCKDARFKVTTPSQSEQPRAKYPFKQELRTAVRPDERSKEDPLRR